MKKRRILLNGFIIFAGIALFFLLMEATGLADQVYLRLFNFVFVIYGVNRTIMQNHRDHINGYLTNLFSAMFTALFSLALSLFALMCYIEFRGGEAYLHTLATNYIFGGGEPSPGEFCIGLAIEGTAAAAIVAFTLMQYWKDKVEKINKVDSASHHTHVALHKR